MYYYILTYLILQILHCMLILYMLDVKKKSNLLQKTYLQLAKKTFDQKKVFTRTLNIRFSIRTNYVIPVKITATHADFGRFIVADHDSHARCDHACFQTFSRAFYISNFANRGLWIFVCLNTVKAFNIIFLIANFMYNQNYHGNCCR